MHEFMLSWTSRGL
ncbi:hypothetical protein LINGRAHAP2_LOCUS4049 [Linum grandiflorum]